MCGIVGIFDLKSKRDIDRELLLQMRDQLIHRGPDEAGIYLEAGIGLAHRRLSIIDLSSGQQPLSVEEGLFTITFNGEIYNFMSVRQELQAKGHQFKTHSDTETILRAWIEWKDECVQHLRGMFAFAIWDKRSETLFCARDRLGVKPFLYTMTKDGYFLFASEHKALLVNPAVERNIDTQSVETYFALGYIADPDSIYQDIKKLPAGHTMTLRRGQGPMIKEYWDLPFESNNQLLEENAQQEMYERLKEAVDIRLMAEVPLGAFLSGGVDSSAVVAIMSELSQEAIKTCSIGFDDPKFNEAEFANEVASYCKTDHFQKIVSSNDYDLIDTLIDVYDEPYADSSALPTYRVCELASSQVTVAISGDGADELMSGYRHHLMHLNEERIRSLIPQPIRTAVFGTLGKLYPKADWAPRFLRAKSTFQGLAMDSVSAYFQTVSQNNDSTRNKLFSQDLKNKLNGFNAVDIFQKHAEKAPNKDPQALIQYLDAKTYLTGDILTKVDRASMAHSIEVRSPFLDHKWVEWITSIDNKYKYDGKTGKSLLKKTMEPYLPEGILYRNKMGFSVPLANWFRGPLKERMQEVLHGDVLNTSGWFNQDYLKQVEKQHLSGAKDHSTLIWSLVMFDGFLRKHNAWASNNTANNQAARA
jgi:asparagine synthase (glutamine-hydrolysing)